MEVLSPKKDYPWNVSWYFVGCFFWLRILASSVYLKTCWLFVGYRSNNFIVGLTNDHPSVRAPVLWNYTVCGQYPGSVPDGATVSLQCANVCERALRFRYVIIQFPLINDQMNVCEIEVFTIGRQIVCIASRCKQLQWYSTVVTSCRINDYPQRWAWQIWIEICERRLLY